ncbi:GatB/YqeY domain-containing protein [Lapidilactobacillus gannanensis]|uniref:GatB/YqeY domain-containing protein n=1 Tax=Lapidilactobacillus gannanensis TaxID=2486002 RepID=A0ABW4BNM7_9LACO|nr:GatB/YqeY domain-containing protein [Lapidilactobacillus gannanensis]
MDFNAKIMEDLKAAMKAKDKTRLAVIRSIKSALMNAKIKKNEALTPDDELAVVASELKQRQDSLVEFENAGRQDLADQLKAEIAIVKEYLPAALSDEDLAKIVDDTISEVGASSMKDMGNVMKALMPKVKGRADGAKVNQLVKAALSK